MSLILPPQQQQQQQKQQQQQVERGAANGLHKAAYHGSTERIVALLARGFIEIDGRTSQGLTPLMIASLQGYSRIVRILLNKGASASLVGQDRYTSLHYAALQGHPAVIELLLAAGCDLEAGISPTGSTPLHLAAEAGCPRVMRALIEAGANPNWRRLDGATPLSLAASYGHLDAVKLLLDVQADPLLTRIGGGHGFVPLSDAAGGGFLGIVREMIGRLGLDGCGGAKAGLDALGAAAQEEQVEIMGVLADVGVVDDGRAMATAAARGSEGAVKFLLRQREGQPSAENFAYLNDSDSIGQTPLIWAIRFARYSSARIAKLLIAAGADAASFVRLTNPLVGGLIFSGTPLGLTELHLRDKKIYGEDATEEQLQNLEATRRLLLRVEAVRAASWLWPSSEVPPIAQPAAEGPSTARKASTPVVAMLPILRRRARRRGVIWGSLIRWVNIGWGLSTSTFDADLSLVVILKRPPNYLPCSG